MIKVMAMVMDICFRIEAVMHVIEVLVMVMEVMDICFRIEAVKHVIEVMAMVMEEIHIFIGSKL